MSCPHAVPSAVQPPGRTVHKDDCAYCGWSCKHGEGLHVCLACHDAFCPSHSTKHHALSPSHTMYAVYKETPPPPPAEEVKDVTQLGVVQPPTIDVAIHCRCCGTTVPAADAGPVASAAAEQVVFSPSTWTAEAIAVEAHGQPPCEHTLLLAPLSHEAPPPTSSSPCALCGGTLNNWVCMTCGAVGCPRHEAGGQEHAIAHHTATGHSVVLKIGTVTADGGGDLYCYACDREVSDPALREHLAHFGIDASTATKTAKSLGEMAYDYTMQHDFSAITEAGESLVPAYGPYHTGLRNFGNSCYIGSTLQALLNTAPFRRRFVGNGHTGGCASTAPRECEECQWAKAADGIASGFFSVPDAPAHLNGLVLRDFKAVVAGGHPDFTTTQQQDAQEYYTHIMERLEARGDDVVEPFQMLVVSGRSCGQCGAVASSTQRAYSLTLPVPHDATEGVTVEQLLTAWVAPSAVEARCDACGERSTLELFHRIANFPSYVLLKVGRQYFDAATCTIRKHDVDVACPTSLQLSDLRWQGPRPSSPSDAPPTGPPLDELGMGLLLSMGIADDTAAWALRKSRNNVEAAVSLALDHPDGPPAAKRRRWEPSDGGPRYTLIAIVSHIGKSAHTGHYVAHVRHGDEWIIANDETVARSCNPPFNKGTLYLFARDE